MKHGSKRSGRIIGGLLVVTAIVMTTAAVLQSGRTYSPVRADDRRGAAQFVARTNVLFAGDSFTAGAGVQEDGDSYPELIARTAGLHLFLDAQGGTGFLADGKNTGNGVTSRMIDRLHDDFERFATVDVLVVDAGRNDLGHPIDTLAGAISAYLSAARKYWPNARIIVIFPSFVSSGPFDGYRELLNAIKRSLAQVNGQLVNPVAEEWYHGIQTDSLVTSDKVHPNGAGNTLIAQRLLTSLRHLGAIPSA
jgi:lysophospholipase L1-like esterase